MYKWLLILTIFWTRPIAAQLLKPDTAIQHCTQTTVCRLAGDSLSSTFLICIPQLVKLHRHDYHTENVYVLSGSATMILGKDTLNIKTGDAVFIPRSTPHKVIVTSKDPLRVISIQSPQFDGSDRILME